MNIEIIKEYISLVCMIGMQAVFVIGEYFMLIGLFMPFLKRLCKTKKNQWIRPALLFIIMGVILGICGILISLLSQIDVSLIRTYAADSLKYAVLGVAVATLALYVYNKEE